MRARTFCTAAGLVVALAATPALARHQHRMDYPAYPASYAPPMQSAFPVDRALAERCGLHAGSMRPHPIPAYYHDGHDRRRDRFDDRYDDRGPPPPGEGYGPANSGECEAALPPGYTLVSVPGGQDCHDEVVTHEEWVPDYVTVPRRPAYRAPARDKRTKLRRVK